MQRQVSVSSHKTSIIMKCLVFLGLLALCYSYTPFSYYGTKYGGNVNFWKYLTNQGYGFGLQKHIGGYPYQGQYYPYQEYQTDYHYPYNQEYYNNYYGQEYNPYYYHQKYPFTQDYFYQKYPYYYQQYQQYQQYPEEYYYAKYGKYFPEKYYQGHQETTEDVPVTKTEAVTKVEHVPEYKAYEPYQYGKYLQYQGQYPYGYKGQYYGQYYGQYPYFSKHFYGGKYDYPEQKYF